LLNGTRSWFCMLCGYTRASQELCMCVCMYACCCRWRAIVVLCVRCDGAQGQQGDPGGEKKGPWWEKTWSKIHARPLVMKAILRKINITPLLVARQRGMLKRSSSSQSFSCFSTCFAPAVSQRAWRATVRSRSMQAPAPTADVVGRGGRSPRTAPS
jgi:hypothetical protein